MYRLTTMRIIFRFYLDGMRGRIIRYDLYSIVLLDEKKMSLILGENKYEEMMKADHLFIPENDVLCIKKSTCNPFY